jgi:hypothetical protein
MSPLIGSTGVISEYSYRGNLDYLPDDFNIGADVTNQPINVAITRTVDTITAINYKAKVSASPAGAEISVNGAPFSSTVQYVRNGQSVSIRYSPPDYETTYAVILTVGKKSDTFNVTTRQRPEDGIPNAFNFTDQTEVDPPFKTNIESNVVTLTGMSNIPSGQTPRTYDYGTASISGNDATFKVIRLSNGWTAAQITDAVNRGYSSSSYQVLNGDQIQLRMNAGGNAQTVSTTFSVTGTDTTNLASPTTETVSDIWFLTSKNYVASITLSAEPTTVDYNESTTISWTSQNIKLPITITDVGNMYNVSGSRSSYKLNKGVNGGDVTFTATADTLYSPPSTASGSVKVHVDAPPAPSVSLRADSTNIPYNTSTTLRWTSANNTTNTTTSVNSSTPNSFAGSNLNGSASTGNLTSTQTYEIKVNGLEGQTASSSVTVNVQEEPAIEISITSNTTNVNTSSTSYFGADWGRNVRKKLKINGAVVGSYDPSTPALIISSGLVGAFTLINNGSIQGAGGAAGAANGGNGGNGGDAIRADAPGTGGSITIENIHGSVVAGGGGGGGGTKGGKGGDGGSGYKPGDPYTIYGTTVCNNEGFTPGQVVCPVGPGVELFSFLYITEAPRGTFVYQCCRRAVGTAYYDSTPTEGGKGGAGGDGGAGGKGQGYDQSSTVGADGSKGDDNTLGGTNAGDGGHGAYGGNGGNGGNFGKNGDSGSQGGTGNSGTSGTDKNGNRTSGTDGETGSVPVGQGGASGYSLNGTNYTTINGGIVSGGQKSNP